MSIENSNLPSHWSSCFSIPRSKENRSNSVNSVDNGTHRAIRTTCCSLPGSRSTASSLARSLMKLESLLFFGPCLNIQNSYSGNAPLSACSQLPQIRPKVKILHLRTPALSPRWVICAARFGRVAGSAARGRPPQDSDRLPSHLDRKSTR